MVLSHTEQEMVWVEAWNEFYDLIEKHSDGYILLPDFKETSKDGAEGWIRDAAYQSNRIEFSVEYLKESLIKYK